MGKMMRMRQPIVPSVPIMSVWLKHERTINASGLAMNALYSMFDPHCLKNNKIAGFPWNIISLFAPLLLFLLAVTFHVRANILQKRGRRLDLL